MGCRLESYITVKHAASFEFEDRKSVFIADAAPISTEREAIEFIATVKKRYPDAKHHVYAYVLRENQTMRFTDDREPQGTAGMPVLDAIRKRGCTDTVVVVTRYFGGTLLGTGGLVHAYSTSAVGALNAAEVVTYDVYSELEIKVSYSDYQKIITSLTEWGFREAETDYGEDITVKGTVLAAKCAGFSDALVQLTSARVSFKVLSEKYGF